MKKLLSVLVSLSFSLTSVAQWSAQTSGTSNSFTGVYFTSATDGHAVTDVGGIFHYDGVAWTLKATSGSSMYAVGFGGISNGIAVGAGGSAMYTTDGGVTWAGTSTGQGYALTSVFFVDLDTAYAVGNNGTILKTYNGGQTWFPRTSGVSTNLHGVYFADFNEGYAAGDAGLILKTTDAGSTWTALSTGSGANLYSIYFTSLSAGYAVGQGGSVLKTIDAGATWYSMPSNVVNTLYSVYFIDAMNGFACGAGGTIIKTMDQGNTWFTQTSGTVNDLLGIWFTGLLDGFVVGNSGTILNTVDAGCATPSISVSGSSTICDQSSSSLVASGGDIYWSWQPGTGLSATNSATTTASPNTTMIYTVSAYSIDGCYSFTQFTLTVDPLPSLTTTPNDITCNGLCNGSTGAVTTATTFMWQPGGQTTQTISGLCVGVYTVTVTDMNGCSSTASSPINEPSALTAAISVQNDATCLGVNDGTLKASATGGTLPYSITWTPGGSTTTTFANLGVGNYTLTVTDANLCPVATATANVGETSPIFASISGPSALCQNQPAQLTYTTTGATPLVSVDWYSALNGSTFCTADTSHLIQTTGGLESVILTVIDAMGCITHDTLNIPINYGDSLSGLVTEPNSSLVTAGEVYLFQQKLANVGLYDTIGWSAIVNGAYTFPNTLYGDYFVKVIADTSSGAYPNAIPTYYSNKSYPFQWDSALVINHYTCTNSNVTGYDVTILEITPLTGPGVISGYVTAGPGYGQRIIGGNQVMGAPLKGVDVKLGRNPGGSPAARTSTDTITGQYVFTNVPLNQAFTIYVDIPNYGMDSTLTVTLTSADSVSDQNNYFVDSLMVRVDTAAFVNVISFKDDANAISVFPNPVSDRICVEWMGAGRTELALTNALGHEVRKEILQHSKSVIDVSTLPAGVYFVHARTQNNTLVKKILIQH